jgi:hypothetical protein
MFQTQSFKMNASQWAAILQSSNLKRNARHKIDWAINLFRGFEQCRPTQSLHVIRRQLRAHSKQALELHSGLSKLAQTPDAVYALTTLAETTKELSRPSRRPNDTKHLELMLHELSLLSTWLERASYHLPKAKPGAARRAANVVWLVGILDDIRYEHAKDKHAKVRIKRSGKEPDSSRKFITVVCQLAEPELGNGTIERAMQQHIQSRRAR